MSNQYFASFEEFEILEEFNGVPGTYIKSFLISDKVNLNLWQATHEANVSNLETFLGRPGIHYINPQDGKLDHTGATTKEKSLQIQELYRAASIIAVGSDIPTRRHWQMSKMIDDIVAEKIRKKEIKWISPSIWPKEGAVEKIEQTDGKVIDVVHDYEGLHYAFVDEPAFGDEAEIKGFCDGTTKACQLELRKFDAAINNVESLTQHEIKIKKENNSSNSTPNTSDKTKSTFQKTMTNEKDLRKELEDAKKALKATEEELEKEKEKNSKKGTTEEENKDGEEEENKNKDSKKATEDEKEDDKEKTALKARIEHLEKVPLVKEIISTQLSAKIIPQDQVQEEQNKLFKASRETLEGILNTTKSFEAKIQTTSPTSDVDYYYPYVGSVGYNPSESFDESSSSFDGKTDEELLMEASS